MQDEKFVEKRKIMFPSDLFIELTLSPKDVRKTRRWRDKGEDVALIPFWSCERVLLVNNVQFKKWLKRKERKASR